MFLAENGIVADAEASTTTSYPPVFGTGTDRYVSNPPEPSAIMAAVEIWTIKHRLTEVSEDLFPIRFHDPVNYILTDSYICREFPISHLIVPSDRGDTEYTAIYTQFRPQRECESGTCYWSQCGGVGLYSRNHRLCAEEEATSQACEGGRDCLAPQRRESQCRTASAWSPSQASDQVQTGLSDVQVEGKNVHLSQNISLSMCDENGTYWDPGRYELP